nr:MAG TPA: hypothetical protein [Caudoviricetes sp.]
MLLITPSLRNLYNTSLAPLTDNVLIAAITLLLMSEPVTLWPLFYP